MPTTARIIPVPHTSITVRKDRQRKEFNNLEELCDSIRRIGLINPIVVTKDLVLVAGERRLRAWRLIDERLAILGDDSFATIPVHYLEELDEHEHRIVELEENIRREDLPWQDIAAAVTQIHQLFQQEDSSWTLAKTAERVGLGQNMVGKYLQVTRHEDQKVIAAPTVNSALQIIRRADERKAANQENVLKDITRAGLEALDIAPPSEPASPAAPADSIICGDAIKFMATYSGPRFNLIHCDFPYGIGFDSGWDNSAEQWESYKDDPDTYWALLHALANFWDNIAAPSAHLVFWFSMKYYAETQAFFSEKIPALTVDPFPLIWHKSDNRGSLPDPNRGPRRTYETALFGHAGDRKIIKAVANSYAAPTQKSQASHISEKPEPVLRHFFQMLVDENTELFDPTCGAGSALRAAESLGARRVLGVELNEGFATAANKKLNDARRLRNV